MNPRLKIAFADCSPRGFAPRKNFVYRHLAMLYDLEFADDPHVLFFSCWGRRHRQYRCRRVFFTGENERPDWRHCDYAISFDHLDHPDHFRLPNYARGGYGDLRRLVKSEASVEQILAGQTGFCNFVYSNPDCRQRIEFFDKLSRYKRVDSPGAVRNNMTGDIAPRFGGKSWLKSKVAFISRYKFTIAFENSSYPGYTTEKLAQPMWAGSLPIYWGDPLVHLDFNPRSFLNYFDYGSQEALIERIVAVDRDDSLYAEYLRQPWFHGNQIPPNLDPARFHEFLTRIVETPRIPLAQRSRASWFFFGRSRQPASVPGLCAA